MRKFCGKTVLGSTGWLNSIGIASIRVSVAALLLNPEAWTPVTGTPDVMLRKGAAGSRFTNSATMPAPAALARVIPLLPDRPGMPMMPRKPELAPRIIGLPSMPP